MKAVWKVSTHVILWKKITYSTMGALFLSKHSPWEFTLFPFLETVCKVLICCLSQFCWISFTICNLHHFSTNFSFGKSQKLEGAKSGQGRSNPVMEFFAKHILGIKNEQVYCHGEDASHHLILIQPDTLVSVFYITYFKIQS